MGLCCFVGGDCRRCLRGGGSAGMGGGGWRGLGGGGGAVAWEEASEQSILALVCGQVGSGRLGRGKKKS
jgi:hypothetical protein